jgi:hypothetical protein
MTTPRRGDQELPGQQLDQLRLSGIVSYDVNVLNKILSCLDAGTRMNRAALDCMSSALSREARRLPRDMVKRGLKHLVPITPEECRVTHINPFELISAICSHPDLVGVGVFPTELPPHLFETSLNSAMSAVVLTWLTTTSDEDERVDASFHEFAPQVGEAARPHLERVSHEYLPIDVFDYLARPRAVDPPLSKALLDVLQGVSHVVAGAVDRGPSST